MEKCSWFITSEEYWIYKWNELQKTSERGNFTQLTSWIKSYLPYGFQYELLLCIDQDENIITGSANVIVRLPIFSFYVCSYGPWIIDGDLLLFQQFIHHFVNRAKQLHVTATQITIPNSVNVVNGLLLKNFRKENFFPRIASPTFVNIVKLYSDEEGKFDEEQVINSFKSNGRRDIRASYRKGLRSKLVKKRDEIESAYRCFLDNSQNKGYFVRQWQDMKEALFEAIDNGDALMLTAWYEDMIQGAILLYIGGDTINYTLGGVYRHHPDLLTGYFLQFEAMKIAAKMGIRKYNITSGGPVEVKNFKLKFNPTLYQIGTTFYFPNKRFSCILFQFIYRRMKNLLPEVLNFLKLFRMIK